MCGIVAATAHRDVQDILLAGLHALEYRGYDSAGLALVSDGAVQRQRTVGKVGELESALKASPLKGGCGIAHTRWATHGEPNQHNAHPHISGDGLAIVHNGIIENHESLRTRLQDEGYTFSSDTDTEVMVHELHRRMQTGEDLPTAVQRMVAELTGAFAITVVSAEDPELIVGARCGAPLVVGLGFDENFLASDIHALLGVTNRFIYLEEGDVAVVRPGSVRILDHQGAAAERPLHEADLGADAVSRGEYRHYMLKEIHEQPAAVSATLEGRLGEDHVLVQSFGTQAQDLLEKVEHVQIVACGTSYHAGLVVRNQIEQLADIPCAVEVASEYRYRRVVVPANSLFVVISQSGETADTLAALKRAQSLDYLATLAICNVPQSTIVREADLVLMTQAGPEIGVASTKAFTTQLVALQLLVLALAEIRGLDRDQLADYVAALKTLPGLLQQVLEQDDEIERASRRFADKHHALFLGRGSHYPVALEGALKLKEISYIHAEAYPAGELKHGPLALVDADMPVVVVAPNNDLLGKLISNMQVVRARGGQMLVFADSQVGASLESRLGEVIEIDAGPELLAPIVLTIPLQLLAYHAAVLKGTDVDQPRNLAKSVTVE